MEYGNSLLEPTQWHWIIDHAGLLVSVLVFSIAVSATAIWLALRSRYQGTIATLRFKLKEFDEKLNGATPDEVRRRLDSLQARLSRLEPRRLSGTQKAALKKHLTLPETAGITNINVAHDAACGDGKQYAADLVHVIGSCRGWQPFSVTMFGLDERSEAGLAIVCFKHGRTAAGAKLLSKAFTEAGIEHQTIYSMEEQLELAITSRLSAQGHDVDD